MTKVQLMGIGNVDCSCKLVGPPDKEVEASDWTEYGFVVFNQELDGGVLRVHINHLPLEAGVSHDGWGKDNSKILGSHLHHWSVWSLIE